MRKNNKRIPNKRTNVPKKGWKSKAKDANENTRGLLFRIPLDLDVLWREAVRNTPNVTQTDICLALIEGYVLHRHKIDKNIDDAIEQLMEQKENNERKIISASVDDAILKLKKKGFEETLLDKRKQKRPLTLDKDED